MPGVLLKLLVKDKLPHNRKVPVNVSMKEWQLKPLKRKITAESPHECERMAVETLEERERLQRMSTIQHKRLAVETPEERERRLQHQPARKVDS